MSWSAWDGWMTDAMSKEMGAKTFTLFPQLPTELQLLIWQFAAVPKPRIIELHGELRPLSELYAERVRQDGREASAVSYTWKVPAIGLLSACRNARNVGRSLYQNASFDMDRNFVYKSSGSGPIFQPSGSIIMAPNLDILLYSPRTLREMMDIKQKFNTTMVKHLALSLDGKDLVNVGLEAFDNYLSLALGGFPHLQTLELVLGRTRFAQPHFTARHLVEIDVTPDDTNTSKFEDTLVHCGLESINYMVDWAKRLKNSFQLWKEQKPGPWQFMNNTSPKFNFKVSLMARKTCFPENRSLWFVEYWQWTSENSARSVSHKDYGNDKHGKWVTMPIARDVIDYRGGAGNKVFRLFNNGPQTSAEKEMFARFRDLNNVKEKSPKVDINRILERMSSKNKADTKETLQSQPGIPIPETTNEASNGVIDSKMGSLPKIKQRDLEISCQESTHPTTWSSSVPSGLPMPVEEQQHKRSHELEVDEDVKTKESAHQCESVASSTQSEDVEAGSSTKSQKKDMNLSTSGNRRAINAPPSREHPIPRLKGLTGNSCASYRECSDRLAVDMTQTIEKPKRGKLGREYSSTRPRLVSGKDIIDIVASSLAGSVTMADIQEVAAAKLEELLTSLTSECGAEEKTRTSRSSRCKTNMPMSSREEAETRIAAVKQVGEPRGRKRTSRASPHPREFLEDIKRAAFAKAGVSGMDSKSSDEIMEDIQRAAFKRATDVMRETRAPKPVQVNHQVPRPKSEKFHRMPSRTKSTDLGAERPEGLIEHLRAAKATKRQGLSRSTTDTGTMRESSKIGDSRGSTSSSRNTSTRNLMFATLRDGGQVDKLQYIDKWNADARIPQIGLPLRTRTRKE